MRLIHTSDWHLGRSFHRLIEQTTAVAPERLGDLVGHVSHYELAEIDQALRLGFQLD